MSCKPAGTFAAVVVLLSASARNGQIAMFVCSCVTDVCCVYTECVQTPMYHIFTGEFSDNNPFYSSRVSVQDTTGQAILPFKQLQFTTNDIMNVCLGCMLAKQAEFEYSTLCTMCFDVFASHEYLSLELLDECPDPICHCTALQTSSAK